MEIGDVLTAEQEAALLEFDKFLAMDDEMAIMALREVEQQQAAAVQAQQAAAAAAADQLLAKSASERANDDVQVKLVSTLRRRDIRKSVVMDVPEDEIMAMQGSNTAPDNEDDEDDEDEDDEDEDEEEPAKPSKPAEASKPEEPKPVAAAVAATTKADDGTASAATLASLAALPIQAPNPAVVPKAPEKKGFFDRATNSIRSLGSYLKSSQSKQPAGPTQIITSGAQGGAIKQSSSMQQMNEFLKGDKRPPKSDLYEVRLFSLSTAKTSVPYLVEAGEDGFLIRDYDTGAFLREFPLKYIQSMHFIINNKTKERLFVLDYIRTDELARGRHLVGRLVLSSEKNEVIFNELKAAMIALAKKKMANKQTAPASKPPVPKGPAPGSK